MLYFLFINLLFCSSFMSVLFLLDAVFKDKKAFPYYLKNFILGYLIFTLTYFFMLSMGYAESTFIETHELFLNEDERKDYIQKAIYHTEEAKRAYEEACTLSRWYLPTLTEQQNARYCWAAAARLIWQLASNGNIPATCLALIYDTMLEYSYDCSNQWRKMQTLMYQAKAHQELAEHYAYILVYDNDTRPFFDGRHR